MEKIYYLFCVFAVTLGSMILHELAHGLVALWQGDKTAKEAGALTICLTNFGNSPIQRYSDIVLNTRSDETKYSILAMSSRIAQLAIFDALYTYIVMNSNKAAVKAIKETETALQSKKY